MNRLNPLREFRPEVRRPMGWMLAFRWISNTGVRFAFSFLPALARGTGLSVETLGTVLALRDASGLAAPLIGRRTQRHGTVRVMGVGAAIATTAYFVSALGPIGLVVGLILSGLGKVAFDVAMNSWVGDEVVYHRRARASGLVELTWALAALVGLPLCGVLIDRIGWQAAPAMLGLLGLLPVVAIARTPGNPPLGDGNGEVALTFTRSAVGALIGFSAMTFASQLLIVGHGLWLEDDYGLSPTRIGVAVIVIGVIEAVASGATAAYVDAMGKRIAIIGGITVLGAASAVFATVGRLPLGLGLLLVAVGFLGFEFAFISALPLLAELDPMARSKMMGLALGLSTLVRAVGSPIGIAAYNRGGWSMLMGLSAAGSAVTAVVFARMVVEPTGEREPEPIPGP